MNMQTCYLGIEIGGTKLQIVSGDAAGTIQRRWRSGVEARSGGAGIRQQIESTLKEALTTAPKWGGIGVGFGGPIDWQTGLIQCSHQIGGWSGFGLGDWLHSLAQVPVRLDNDANVGALGEALHGAGQGFDPVFYVTLGSGVGGGLAVNSQIYHGAKPGEAEIGHVRLDRQGNTVESRCSGWAVDAKIRRLKTDAPESLLNRLVGDTAGGEARFLAMACQQGDAAAQRILQETAEDLAFGLSHVVHLFHPEIIVLGGGLALVGEPLRAAVAASLQRFVMQAFAPGPQVRLAALGEDAVPMGALVLARKSHTSATATS
jgi:glucokinase